MCGVDVLDKKVVVGSMFRYMYVVVSLRWSSPICV